MADVTRVQDKAGVNFFGGVLTQATFDSPAGTGILAAIVHWTALVGTVNLSSITDDKGNTWTLKTVKTRAGVNSANIYIQIGYCIAPITGVQVVSANFDASSLIDFISIIEMTAGVFDQEAPGATGTAGPVISAGSITTANGSFNIAGGVMDDSSGSGGWTKGTGWDALWLNNGGGSYEEAAEYWAQASGASTTFDMTAPNGGSPWAAVGASFKPSGGGGGQAIIVTRSQVPVPGPHRTQIIMT